MRAEEEGRQHGLRPERRRLQQRLLPAAHRRSAELRPVVRAALPAALGLPAAAHALPAPAPLAAVPQLLLAAEEINAPASTEWSGSFEDDFYSTNLFPVLE